ncbi:MAG: sialidase family protein [Pirellulales bacterium]
MKSRYGLTVLLVLTCRLAVGAEPTVRLNEVKKIWDQAPHNAFTDLIHWEGRFVCAFREGRAHASTDGKIRVLTSTDGDTWQPAAVVALAGYDLRDAGLSRAPDGRLMLIGGAAPRRTDNESAPTGTFVSFSADAVSWSEPAIVVEPGRWLWRVTWNDGKAYGVSYAAGTPDRSTALLVSDDGLQYRELEPKLLADGYPTEAVLRFDGDEALYCLQRRDGKAPANSAMLGVSRPPYTQWQWQDLGIYFGGPNFIMLPSRPGTQQNGLPDARWIAAGRIIGDKGPKTALAWLDVKEKALKPILELPSGGDTSYPGLVWTSASSVESHDGILLVSYYSSHEGKTSIYLAKVKIE